MAETAEQQATVRSITDAEIETLWEKGWVKLPELISRDLAAELLARAKGWMGVAGDEHRKRAHDKIPVFFEVYNHPSREDAVFASVLASPAFGRNITRVLGHETAVRVLDENVAVKLPEGVGGRPTGYHQDFCFLPFDRMTMMYWIALDEVTPDMGMMRFRSGSNRMGPLGRRLFETEEEILEAWPRLARFPSEHADVLAPGDATMHLGLTVHGAPPNTTERARWSYIVVGFPADTLKTIPHRVTEELGLKTLEPLEHDEFPVVWSPEQGRV